MNKDFDLYKIADKDKVPKAGSVLVSEPLIMDYYFGKSVVLLIEHNSEGSFGIVLNKLLNLNINEAIKDFSDIDAKFFCGGPVDRESIHFLHRTKDKISGSVHLFDDISFGGDFEELKEAINLSIIDVSQVKFFLGYSGWSAGQLESELKRNSWFARKISSDEIFQTSSEDLWNLMVNKSDKIYQHWLNTPNDPISN